LAAVIILCCIVCESVQPKVPTLFNGLKTSKLPIPIGRADLDPHVKWFFGPIRVYIPNGISINSATFDRETDSHRHIHTDRLQNTQNICSVVVVVNA